ncbi:hypothetical protein GH714_035149 [Hevea brasiliensis]|uniref:Uncharacterized protein n=1 Tax=Hevea brasiliensis TaxID=3981 RepID=A0A6A6L640_HEVBR|nr:hypothetical protein GH714_035149 [Hevea brasiliensis]
MNINRVVESDDDDEEEEEDIELEMVKRESLRQFDEDAFRRRAGAHYEGQQGGDGDSFVLSNSSDGNDDGDGGECGGETIGGRGATSSSQ